MIARLRKICLCLFFGKMISMAVFAESTEKMDRLAALRELKIVSAVYNTSPTMTISNGTLYKNLPPRTIVKLVLNTAKGSNKHTVINI